MEYTEKYLQWLNEEIFDESTKKELKAIKGDEKEIEDRFYKDLEFGTAGLRGVIGAGTNRMNKYTVTKATQGLANFILKEGTQDKGVAISFDSRHMSPEFSEYTALCLNANGIKTYIFSELRPVPELSFAVRELGCTAGIMITASHNPPEYNGYKVYWDDGAQIISPKDKQIINEVNAITDYSTIKSVSKQEAIDNGLFNVIGIDMDDKYIDALKKCVQNLDIIHQVQKDLKIVYTPLHGAGNIPVQRILKEIGFENVYVVKEQQEPNGDFPTVDYPNPEDEKAFKMALDLAKEVDADLVLATDPDADRLGVYSKDTKTNSYIRFTGNMSGALIAEYEVSQRSDKGTLPNNGAIISTIVSTNMMKAISDNYNATLFEVLTGFKNIGERIREFESTGSYEYLFGFEESYGCLIGTYARDKDGISAVMALCEAAAYYKSKDMTLWDQMNAMYEKYGYYKETQIAITLKGIEGAQKIKEMMENIRKNPPKNIGKYDVIEFRDYKEERIIKKDGTVTKTDLPNSNVLYFDLTNDAWCCMRPSGTEPKIKFYIGVKEESMQRADEELEYIGNEIKKFTE